MNIGSIYHRASAEMCYMRSEDEVVIHIRTGMDVSAVTIVYSDPFEDPRLIPDSDGIWGYREKMIYDKELTDQKWWTVVIYPKWKRLKYHFVLEGCGEKFLLFEEGIFSIEKARHYGANLADFTIPWMNPKDVIRVPEWVKDTIWYQIFPDRFFRKGDICEKENILKWREEGTVSNDERFGGNLKGITEKLDYLHELGINGIYLMPIHSAGTVHHYDTNDYMRIDPCLGSDDDMRLLVKKAHSLGIRVMMDAVFNHCGAQFAPWLDIVKNGRSSIYFDWFFINSLPLDIERDTMDGRYYTFSFFSNMPKLNTNNDEVVEYFKKVCTSWITEYDIDGIRLDAGNEVSHYFIKQLNHTIKNLKADFYLLCENWHDSISWLNGEEFDAVTNYMFSDITGRFFMDVDFTKADFIHGMNACYTRYPEQYLRTCFNMLDSHDTPRLFTRSGGYDVFLQQLAVLFTFPGSPCIYYGTEIAMEGFLDPDCRRCMPWNSMDTDVRKKARGDVRALIRLRNEKAALRSTEYRFTCQYEDDRMIEYNRMDSDGNTIRVLLNCSDHAISFCNEKGQVLFSYKTENGNMKPGSVCIMKLPQGDCLEK